MRKFLYSPGFGSGWSTWNRECRDLFLFDPDIIEFIEGGGRFIRGDDWSADKNGYNHPLLDALAAKAAGHDHLYYGGASDLRVGSCPDGAKFRIEEYDGSESVRYNNDDTEWH